MEFTKTSATMTKKPREVFLFNDMLIIAKIEKAGVLSSGNEPKKYKLVAMIPYENLVINSSDEGTVPRE